MENKKSKEEHFKRLSKIRKERKKEQGKLKNLLLELDEIVRERKKEICSTKMKLPRILQNFTE